MNVRCGSSASGIPSADCVRMSQPRGPSRAWISRSLPALLLAMTSCFIGAFYRVRAAMLLRCALFAFWLRLRHQAEQFAAQRYFLVHALGDAFAHAAAQFHHGRVRSAVIHLIAFLASREDAAAMHYAQVARHIGLRGAGLFDDLRHGFLGLANRMHDTQPRGLGEHVEVGRHGVKGVAELIHVVSGFLTYRDDYMSAGAYCQLLGTAIAYWIARSSP